MGPTALLALVFVIAGVVAATVAVEAHRIAGATQESRVRELTRLATYLGAALAVACVSRAVTLLAAPTSPSLTSVIVGLAGALVAAALGGSSLRVLRRFSPEHHRTERLLSALTDYRSGALPDDSSLAAANLTRREREVVAVIRSGQISDSAIAESLHVAPATAATHVRNILRKTGLSSRRQLLLLAVEPDVTPARAPASAGRRPGPLTRLQSR